MFTQWIGEALGNNTNDCTGWCGKPDNKPVEIRDEEAEERLSLARQLSYIPGSDSTKPKYMGGTF